MFLLFEEKNYQRDQLRELGLGDLLRETSQSMAKCNYVGFHRDYENDITVFILPKIFLHQDKVFGEYEANMFLSKPTGDIVTPTEFEIIRSLVEKLYFCLRQYQIEETKSDIVERGGGYSIKTNIGVKQTGAFEAMLSLIAFNKNNPSLFVQERQIIESRSQRNVNWRRTLTSCLPLWVGSDLIYPDMISKTRSGKTSDILLVIFYSLLNEFKSFDPTIKIDNSVELLSPRQFGMLKPKIQLILKKSRSLYFSDKFKQLHALLQSYFFAENATYSTERIEFLVTDDFQIVFERMVDSLLSDDFLLRQYKYLKDGREIDHLFGENDIFKGKKIIYIGDSKYYRDPLQISRQKYKQFSYARNIIQENIYVINRGEETIYSRNYRDPVSEGYNVTPNFFVFGVVQLSYLENSDLLTLDDMKPEFSFHFPNRLFDRDTLHVLYFRVDFIALMNFYVHRQKRISINRQLVRSRARKLIQRTLIQHLNERYSFHISEMGQDFIEQNFRVLHGKIFTSPAIYPRYVIALDKTFINENNRLLLYLRSKSINPIRFDLSRLDEI